MNVAARLDELLAASDEADNSSYGDYPAVEPYYQEILRLIQDHPEQRPYFVGQFILMVTGNRSVPESLVPYCMRELRYPEVLDATKEHFDLLHRANKHARYMNFCSHIVKSYTDFVWEDAGMWDHFRKKELSAAIVPALIARLSSEDVDIQFNALIALESIGPVAADGIPAVVRLLDTSDPSGNISRRSKLVLKALTEG